MSGGLDSVVAVWAARDKCDVVAALTFDYGQRAAEREVEAAARVAEKIGCDHLVVALPWLGELGNSALTDHAAQVPKLVASALDDTQTAPQSAAAVWVPNRNGVFLNVAAAHAEALDCHRIICGFNAEEAATFPDNSTEFMEAADRFFELSTMAKPRVMSPTARLSKREIVLLGQRLGAPLQDVWSCYHGGEQHCWECESCQRLKRAVTQARVWQTWQETRRPLTVRASRCDGPLSPTDTPPRQS